MRVLAALLAASLAAHVHGQALNAPASWYGIVPGISKEPNVIALYGPGYFRDTLGDTGSRTYISAKDGSTLVFVFGFDKVVESITWEANTSADIPRAVRPNIRIKVQPKHWLGWSPALVTGATAARVTEWLGKPDSARSTDTEWTYPAFEGDCDGAELTLRFTNGVVTYVQLVAPTDE